MADSTVVPLYNQGHPYRRGAISPDGDRTDWFAVAPPVLREMVSALDRRRADDYDHLFPIPYVPATAATFLAQRYVFHHLHSEGPPDPLYVEEAVLTTLTDVLERAFGTRDLAESSLTHHRLAQRAREHLNRTYLRKESVADVAAAVGTSVFHLCRVFRRETGTSLHAYRTDLRLRRSLEWLHDRADILDARARRRVRPPQPLHRGVPPGVRHMSVRVSRGGRGRQRRRDAARASTRSGPDGAGSAGQASTILIACAPHPPIGCRRC